MNGYIMNLNRALGLFEMGLWSCSCVSFSAKKAPEKKDTECETCRRRIAEKEALIARKEQVRREQRKIDALLAAQSRTTTQNK
jgi:hypothetical protein